jgi:hypothetical protein
MLMKTVYRTLPGRGRQAAVDAWELVLAANGHSAIWFRA